MKNRQLYISIFALLATACGSGQMQFYADRLRYAQDTGKAEVEVTIDYPGDCKEAYADSVRYYINQWLGDSYEGDLNNGQELVDYYGMTYITEMESLRPEVETATYLKYVMVSMECDDDKFISYSVYNETFSGGAHGFYTQQGYTFDKRTGELVTCDFIETPEDPAFQQLLRQGLTDYFGPYPTDDWMWPYDELLPMPQCQPFLDKEGVTFIYQPYEIAPYATGMPFVTIPYDEVSPFLTQSIRSLISEERTKE